MTLRSTPRCSSDMAAAWRSVCGFTFFAFNEGQLRRAAAMCFATRCCRASALRRPPLELGKIGSSGCPACCASHALRTAATSGRSGSASRFTTFAEATYMSAYAKFDIPSAQGCDFAVTESSLNGDEQESLVSPSDPCTGIGSGYQCGGLFVGQECYRPLCIPLRRKSQDTLTL